MKRFFRYWKYYRDGYHIYLAFPVQLLSFTTVIYYLLMEQVPILKFFFSHYVHFLFATIVISAPLAVLLGWFHSKRGLLATEQTIGMENNPLGIRQTVVSLEATVAILEKLELKPSKDLLDTLWFWKDRLRALENT